MTLNLVAYLNQRFQWTADVSTYANLYAGLGLANWRMQVRPQAGSAVVTLDFATGGSPQNVALTATYNPDAKTIVFRAPTSLMALLPAADYSFDFGFTLPGADFERVDGGTITLSTGVTRAGVIGAPAAPASADDTVTASVIAPAMQGPTGPAGPAGPAGATGPAGPPGTNAASALTGSTLASNVTASSLTSVGTLISLSVAGSAAFGSAASSGSSAGYVANDRTTTGYGLFYRTGGVNYLSDSAYGNVLALYSTGYVQVLGRLGVGTSGPATAVHAYGASGNVGVRVQSGTLSGDVLTDGTTLFIKNYLSGSNINYTVTGAASHLFYSNGVLQASISNTLTTINTALKLASITSGILSVDGSGNVSSVPASVAPLQITGGLPSAMSGSSTTAAITVSAFTASDATAVAQIASGASISWAVSNGNAANGYAGGTTLPNSATIHMYACQGGSGICTYASTTFGMAAASAPAGYNTYVRRLFSFNTNSSGAPIAFTPNEVAGGGYLAYLGAAITDVSAVAISAANPGSRTLFTMSVPQGLKIQWFGRVETGANAASVYSIVSSPDEPDLDPVSLTTASGADINAGSSGGPANGRPILTSATGQIGVRHNSTAASSFSVFTLGFTDFRRN